MKKDVKIGNVIVPLKASAFTPFLYKSEFGGDLSAEMKNLLTISKEGQADLLFVGQCAYTMAKEAAGSGEFPSLQDWLEQFDIFDIYTALPEIIELWGANIKQGSTPKKK